MRGTNIAAVLKTVVGVVGLAGVSALVAGPALAQVNPAPSIFSEPPYNRAASAPAPEAMEMPEAPAAMEAPAEPPAAMAAESIVDIAASSESFQTLTAALTAAELTEVLQSEGPFTVFAPTDEAFAALPEGTVEALLLPENRDLLVEVLTYHVVPGAVTSGELTSGEVATAAGSPVTIMLGEGSVMVNDANVIQPDVMASNGVIHVIDKVILPPGM